MNYLEAHKEEIRNAQRVYLSSTDDEYYEDEYVAGRLYIDKEREYFVFMADDKEKYLFPISTEYDNIEWVWHITQLKTGEKPLISIKAKGNYYHFVDREEFDRKIEDFEEKIRRKTMEAMKENGEING